jgi:hypothetical protein
LKKNCSTRSAFFISRLLIGVVLILISGAFALFAFGLTPLNNGTSPTDNSGWFHRLASAFGVHLDSGKLAALPDGRGGGGPRFKSLGEPTQESSQADATTTTYRGPHNDTRPVEPIRTVPLRQMKAIPPALAPARVEREPIRPKPPTDSSAAGRSAQTLAGSPLSAPNPTGLIFEGVGTGIPGFSPNSNPPDTNGRVGATQYVQWNNTSFAVFSKNGTLLFGPAAGNTLFQPLGGVCATHNDGDPVVSYDILSGRWILSQFAVGASPDFSHQCVAVSATSDALGSYYLYDFVTDHTNFVDYPKTAVWPDGYYMSGHVFNPAGTVFLAGRIFVFERDKMLQGLPARQLQKDLKKYGNKPQFGFLPSDLDSLTPPPAGAAAFLIGPDPNTTNKLDSTRVKVTWGNNPTITLTETQIAASWDSAPCVNDNLGSRVCVPQPLPATSADYLDNLDFRFMYRLAYRNFGGSPAQESLVGNITVTGGPSNPKHGAIRWYEFRNAGGLTTTPTVFQASTYDPNSEYRWMGSIAMDNSHNIALGYSKSSLSTKPGIYITGRLGSDPPNTLGAEATVFAGLGVQLNSTGAGSRWGDYSAMTLDPVDQCTFFYTNEYLPNNGGFNWATKIASYKFPSCTSAPGWGTVTGTIRSTTGPNGNVPLSGVIVTLNNGYAAATNSNGVYSMLVPPGSYTATAADPDRNCTASIPASASVVVTSGGTATQNFVMSGGSNLEANSFAINDSSAGNGNSGINSNECVDMNFTLKNNGCARETAIAATLSSTTPGVAVIQARSAYPNMAIDQTAVNSTPFRIQTSQSFVCGQEITFNLDLVYASGHKVLTYTVPSCTGGADQTIPSNVIDANDPAQEDRLGRFGIPSGCGGNDCPGGFGPGTRRFQTFNFRNNATLPACFTVTINAQTNVPGTGDIESAAYLGTYNPTNLCLNYLGDTGIVGLGTSVPNASYSFVVPGQSDFVVVVNTTGVNTTSSTFSGTVSGFFDLTPGPGPCP